MSLSGENICAAIEVEENHNARIDLKEALAEIERLKAERTEDDKNWLIAREMRESLRGQLAQSREECERLKDKYYLLHKKVNHLSVFETTDKLTESQAECARMREALEKSLIKVDWNSDQFEDIKQYNETRQIILSALAPGAGKEYAERVRRLEAVAEAAEGVAQKTINLTNCTLCAKEYPHRLTLNEALEALAALGDRK